MPLALAFASLRDQSFGVHPSFNFATLSRNLLDDFNERESSILQKDEQMPVYLRIRPLNPGEPSNKVLFACSATKVVLKPSVEDKGLRAGMFAFGQSSHEFTFSRVFGEVTTQAEIFKAVAAERVSDFLEGVNGLVFAYGTTSSGKTYSLQGRCTAFYPSFFPLTSSHIWSVRTGTAGNGGVIPRALECIFRSVALNPTERLVPRGFDEVQEVTEAEAEKRRCEKALLLHLARTAESSSRSCAVSWESVRPPSEVKLSASTGGEAVARVEEECLEVSFAYKDSAAFCFWISFVEIYNEVVYDLLDPNFVSTVEKWSGASSSGLVGGGGVAVGGGGSFGVRRSPLDLRTDKRGNVFVKGVRWYTVTSAEEAYSLISVGRRCQRVGATRLNESSSRSHTILTLRALRSRRGAPIGVGAGTVGSSSLLSFCDLAGSERCAKAATLAQVQRLREANSINTSLLTLGKCIEALRHNQRRGGGGGNPRIVPYRESRLTRLFQNFFVAAGTGVGGRGRSRACLLVNAAPCAPLAEETLHSLRFSALAGQVLMSTAAPPLLPPPKAAPSESAAAAAASAAIQDQLRAQLLRQGFRLRWVCLPPLIAFMIALRVLSPFLLVFVVYGQEIVVFAFVCSGSLLGRRVNSSVGSVATLAAAASGETTMMRVEEVGETATVVRHGVSGGGDGDNGDGGMRRPLAEWMEKEAVEAELERLPREALVEMVHELLAAVAEALPAEVEAARSETRADVTATMGEELLRMEEQYELLLQNQEREFEARLVEEHRKQKHKQQRGRQRKGSEALGPHRQRGSCTSGADCTWASSACVVGGEGEVEVGGSEVGGSETVESSGPWTREPSAKTRRMEEMGDELAEADEETEEEEECPSCAHYVKEVARLREELEEARGDLADQQDAIGGVMAQRDAFEVEVRRLEFLVQLAKQPLEVNPAKPASTATTSAKATVTTSSTATLIFPPLLGVEVCLLFFCIFIYNSVSPASTGLVLADSVVAPSSLSTEEATMFGKQQKQKKEQSSCVAKDTHFFPPLMCSPDRVCVNGDVDADADIIPPTPDAVVAATAAASVVKQVEAEGEGGGVKVEAGAGSIARPRAESREVLSQLAHVQLDAEWSTRTKWDEEVKAEPVENGRPSKTSVVRMASFLAHEAEAEAAAAAIARESALQSRCEALLRELSDARSAHEEVVVQLAEVQRRLTEYEANRELVCQYCKRETLDAAVQTEVVKVEVEEGDVVVSGRRGTRGRRRHGQRGRKTVVATKRETSALVVPSFEVAGVEELNDSDAENALCAQLARGLSRIQVDVVAGAAVGGGGGDGVSTGEEEEEEEDGDEEVVERGEGKHGRRKRGGQRGEVKNRSVGGDVSTRVTRSMCVEGGGGELREEHQEVANVRRLAPLLEAREFVNLESDRVEEPNCSGPGLHLCASLALMEQSVNVYINWNEEDRKTSALFFVSPVK
ncbi:kinesin protein KIF20A [Echinococcus multilocularis]|uniref:Kinesin protein KIF20A n=1 Tax=Echinococcus multilocularis TaxID=6211 RepID=A0A068YIP4_ECHMU|nr:kinesin protein KIF20A [Echinococcus multilocularis]